ncbi:hypothetical protein BCR34DRAFT_139839 [Clohesyomyces aquaticus]|uniref:Uncharacterized protein n=1 Tax=Clohesyomyces aquaticus TaxID=1231657 RepID=A0A1Y1YMN9_9PLEO|nr:hypothetical protein BCR34DRAFT_139839 [Clohesyomyces aquaticus]
MRVALHSTKCFRANKLGVKLLYKSEVASCKCPSLISEPGKPEVKFTGLQQYRAYIPMVSCNEENALFAMVLETATPSDRTLQQPSYDTAGVDDVLDIFSTMYRRRLQNIPLGVTFSRRAARSTTVVQAVGSVDLSNTPSNGFDTMTYKMFCKQSCLLISCIAISAHHTSHTQQNTLIYNPSEPSPQAYSYKPGSRLAASNIF